MLRIVLRHISGSRATEVDVIPLGAHQELILGRAPSAAVRFDPQLDRAVGRHHARITRSAANDGEFVLTDLTSRNGTFLNGQRVEMAAPVRAGDLVQLGEGGPVLEFQVD
ncbi:MAG: FHA domain-containing protein [Gemmatimonadota bacterium]